MAFMDVAPPRTLPRISQDLSVAQPSVVRQLKREMDTCEEILRRHRESVECTYVLVFVGPVFHLSPSSTRARRSPLVIASNPSGPFV